MSNTSGFADDHRHLVNSTSAFENITSTWDVNGTRHNWTKVTLRMIWEAPRYRCWPQWIDSVDKNSTFVDCLCWNSTAYSPAPAPPPAPDPLWTGCKGPGDWYSPNSASGISVVNPDARLRFGRGALTAEGQYVTGTGVVEFSG